MTKLIRLLLSENITYRRKSTCCATKDNLFLRPTVGGDEAEADDPEERWKNAGTYSRYESTIGKQPILELNPNRSTFRYSIKHFAVIFVFMRKRVGKPLIEFLRPLRSCFFFTFEKRKT